MHTITGKIYNDYFIIICEKCGTPTKNKYLGWDPAVPHFEATCEKCNISSQWKLDPANWKGLPSKPHV